MRAQDEPEESREMQVQEFDSNIYPDAFYEMITWILDNRSKVIYSHFDIYTHTDKKKDGKNGRKRMIYYWKK